MSARRDPVKAGELSTAIAEDHILVTCGAGGVGKTTTAAAIGLAGARLGRRVLVLTIDPARRLAQAMGLEELDDSPNRVELPGVEGELYASMLDMTTTFDRLIDRHASSPQAARNIKTNRIYRTLSSTLSGTQEYMAMERLHELHESGEWDLLVIDTPPTRTALDFLEAPKRMTSFLEGRLLRLLLKPGMVAGKGYLKLVGAGATAFMRVAGKVTGMELLEDLAQFFRNFEGMYEGFKHRADQVLTLLQQPASRFVVVTSPEPPPLREAKFFLERLQQEGLHDAGVVVNRIRPAIADEPDDDTLLAAAAGQSDDLEGRAVAAALRLLARTRSLAARQRRDVEAALFGLTPRSLVEVPLLAADVHDLASLGAIADILGGDATA